MRKPQHVEIGLVDRIHPIANQLGHETLERWKYQVSVITKANSQIGDRDRKHRAASAATPPSRCAPPSAHQAPNTNKSCQANGLKNQTPFG